MFTTERRGCKEKHCLVTALPLLKEAITGDATAFSTENFKLPYFTAKPSYCPSSAADLRFVRDRYPAWKRRVSVVIACGGSVRVGAATPGTVFSADGKLVSVSYVLPC